MRTALPARAHQRRRQSRPDPKGLAITAGMSSNFSDCRPAAGDHRTAAGRTAGAHADPPRRSSAATARASSPGAASAASPTVRTGSTPRTGPGHERLAGRQQAAQVKRLPRAARPQGTSDVRSLVRGPRRGGSDRRRRASPALRPRPAETFGAETSSTSSPSSEPRAVSDRSPPRPRRWSLRRSTTCARRAPPAIVSDPGDGTAPTARKQLRRVDRCASRRPPCALAATPAVGRDAGGRPRPRRRA